MRYDVIAVTLGGSPRTVRLSCVVSMAPNAVSRLIEWHAYDCGCVYRITVGVTDPQRYVAAVMKADKTGEI